MKKKNLKKLKTFLGLSDIEMCEHVAKNYVWSENIDNELFYLDNGADILLVAHLDTVFQKKQIPRTVRLGKETIIFSPHCDDRVGVFVCLEMLKHLDVDILLTTGEESMQSTAYWFENIVTHEYNWVVGFDRAKDDVVLYEYDACTELVQDLSTVFRIGIGSYSDICELEALERGCFNVGVGYHFQHTDRCFVSISMMEAQIARFLEFYDAFKDKCYEYEPHDMWENEMDFWDKYHGQGTHRGWSHVDWRQRDNIHYLRDPEEETEDTYDTDSLGNDRLPFYECEEI